MSLTFSWRPVKDGTVLPVARTSDLADAMHELFGGAPWHLDAGSYSALRGLMAGMRHEREALTQIIDAIDKHGNIQVDAR